MSVGHKNCTMLGKGTREGSTNTETEIMRVVIEGLAEIHTRRRLYIHDVGV